VLTSLNLMLTPGCSHRTPSPPGSPLGTSGNYGSQEMLSPLHARVLQYLGQEGLPSGLESRFGESFSAGLGFDHTKDCEMQAWKPAGSASSSSVLAQALACSPAASLDNRDLREMRTLKRHPESSGGHIEEGCLMGNLTSTYDALQARPELRDQNACHAALVTSDCAVELKTLRRPRSHGKDSSFNASCTLRSLNVCLPESLESSGSQQGASIEQLLCRGSGQTSQPSSPSSLRSDHYLPVGRQSLGSNGTPMCDTLRGCFIETNCSPADGLNLGADHLELKTLHPGRTLQSACIKEDVHPVHAAQMCMDEKVPRHHCGQLDQQKLSESLPAQCACASDTDDVLCGSPSVLDSSRAEARIGASSAESLKRQQFTDTSGTAAKPTLNQACFEAAAVSPVARESPCTSLNIESSFNSTGLLRASCISSASTRSSDMQHIRSAGQLRGNSVCHAEFMGVSSGEPKCYPVRSVAEPALEPATALSSPVPGTIKGSPLYRRPGLTNAEFAQVPSDPSACSCPEASVLQKAPTNEQIRQEPRGGIEVALEINDISSARRVQSRPRSATRASSTPRRGREPAADPQVAPPSSRKYVTPPVIAEAPATSASDDTECPIRREQACKPAGPVARLPPKGPQAAWAVQATDSSSQRAAGIPVVGRARSRPTSAKGSGDRRESGASQRSASAGSQRGASAGRGGAGVGRPSTSSSGVQSNRKMIRSALERSCFKGEPNRAQREQVLQTFDAELQGYERFIILFRTLHTGRHDLRALYAYQDGLWTRVLQLLPSPVVLEERMVAQRLRYDSGGKEFKEVPTLQELLNVADAVFLDPQHLQKCRVVNQGRAE